MRNIDPSDRPPPDTPLVQFGLRHLFAAVAGISGVIAVVGAAPGYTKVAVVVAALVVVAHVLATLVGSRLRENSERRRLWYQARGSVDPDEAVSRCTPPSGMLPPHESPLSKHSTQLRWMPVVVGTAAGVGGLAGYVLLDEIAGQNTTQAGLLLGAFSTAALGAWTAFLASGFVGISRHAWRESAAAERRDRSRGRRPTRH